MLQIKDKGLAEGIKRALQESHEEESEYRAKTIQTLKNHLTRVQQRLDRLYDDRLDDRVDTATYDRKSAELKSERETLEAEVKRLTTAGDKHKELTITIFDLSQNAQVIYAKATPEEKRKLLNYVFENLIINAGLVDPTFTPPFAALAAAADETNR